MWSSGLFLPSLFSSFTWIIFCFLFQCHVLFLFVFFRALSFLCPLFFFNLLFWGFCCGFFFLNWFVDSSSVPTSKSSFSSFPVFFYPSPYQPVYFSAPACCSALLRHLFLILCYSLLFVICVYTPKPMCSCFQSFPCGVLSNMYQ